MLFWVIAPTMLARTILDKDINHRVDQMWAIHENRVKKGLGSTVQKTGVYSQEAHPQDSTFQLNGGITVRKD